MDRDIEELRAIAVTMGKPLDKLLYEMLTDAMNENQELKKQNEEYIVSEMKLKDKFEKQRKEYQETYKDVRIETKEYKNQQKVFIEWLKDKIKMSVNPKTRILLKSILRNYEEIIGGSNES